MNTTLHASHVSRPCIFFCKFDASDNVDELRKRFATFPQGSHSYKNISGEPARTAIIGSASSASARSGKCAGATYSREYPLVGGNTAYEIVVSSGARIMVVIPYSFCCTVMADAHQCSVSTSRAEGFAAPLQL